MIGAIYSRNFPEGLKNEPPRNWLVFLAALGGLAAGGAMGGAAGAYADHLVEKRFGRRRREDNE